MDIRPITFPIDADVVCLKSFPIVKLEAKSATLSLYGIVERDGKTLIEKDYSEYIDGGKEGICQPDGRFVFPFLRVKWIPDDKYIHGSRRLCWVYNLYDEDGSFLGFRRCDSMTILIKESVIGIQ